MAIAEGKKRMKFTFDDETKRKLDYLYHRDLDSNVRRESQDTLYISDTLTKIIDDAYKLKRAFNN